MTSLGRMQRVKPELCVPLKMSFKKEEDFFPPVIDKLRDDYKQVCASWMLSEAFQSEGQDFQMEKQTQKMECNTLTVVKINSVSAMMGFSLCLFLGYLFQDIPGKPWPV